MTNRRAIHSEGDPLTHEQSPDDDPHSRFRRTLCDRYISPDRSWSSRPITPERDDVDCPDCIAQREPVR